MSWKDFYLVFSVVKIVIITTPPSLIIVFLFMLTEAVTHITKYISTQYCNTKSCVL